MYKKLLNIYRHLPHFKGKLRLGKFLFRSFVLKNVPVQFIAHDNIFYSIPNTLENLGVELLINGVYEKEVVRFLQKQVPDGSVFFDIGANIGSLGLPVVKLKPSVKYYGFEASPMVYIYLQDNFKKNDIACFQVYNQLVHKDDHQPMKFYQSELYGKSSLAPTYSREYTMIDSVSMDAFCRTNNIEKIDWMKVDVQGFELNVFEGMQILLKEKRVENILFEFEAWADEQAGIQPGAAQLFLQQKGYMLYGLNGLPLSKPQKKNETMIWARPARN